MANLQQRLYPLQGQATLADIPWLYGALAAQRAARQGIGGTNAAGGAPMKVTGEASGGTAPGGGGPLGVRDVPGLAPVAAPGRTGAVTGPGIGMDDRPRSEGGGYGGGNIGAESARYADMARRGVAPLTLDGVMTALQNAYGLMSSPLMTGAESILSQSGIMDQLGLGGMPVGAGIQDIPGYQAWEGAPPKTLREFLDGMNRQLGNAGFDRDLGNRLAARDVPSRMANVATGGWVDPALGARMMSRGPRSSFGGGRDGSGGRGERGGRGGGLGGQGSQAGDIGGQAGRGGRRAY